MSELDVTTEHEVWALQPGEYQIRILITTRQEIVKEATAQIDIQSQREAKYFFNQYTDLARRVRKLHRATGRLFTRETTI